MWEIPFPYLCEFPTFCSRTNLGKIPFPYVHEKNKLGEIPFPFKQRHQLLHQQHKLERSSPRGKASLATEQTPQEQLAGQD